MGWGKGRFIKSPKEQGLFIFSKMFPFTQKRVGAQRAAGREKALTSSLRSSARHNLTCIFFLFNNCKLNEKIT